MKKYLLPSLRLIIWVLAIANIYWALTQDAVISGIIGGYLIGSQLYDWLNGFSKKRDQELIQLQDRVIKRQEENLKTYAELVELFDQKDALRKNHIDRLNDLFKGKVQDAVTPV